MPFLQGAANSWKPNPGLKVLEKVNPYAYKAMSSEPYHRRMVGNFEKIKQLLMSKTGMFKLAQRSAALTDLLKAKKLSDNKDFENKNRVLAKLLKTTPDKFYIDSELNKRYVGLTHAPSGFKIHAPRSIVPAAVATRIKERNVPNNN